MKWNLNENTMNPLMKEERDVSVAKYTFKSPKMYSFASVAVLNYGSDLEKRQKRSLCMSNGSLINSLYYYIFYMEQSIENIEKSNWEEKQDPSVYATVVVGSGIPAWEIRRIVQSVSPNFGTVLLMHIGGLM
jgi:hypothetical protein